MSKECVAIFFLGNTDSCCVMSNKVIEISTSNLFTSIMLHPIMRHHNRSIVGQMYEMSSSCYSK